MKLRYPAWCKCGASLEAGTDVQMALFDGGWAVVACPACSWRCDRGTVALERSDIRPEKRGGTLAQQIAAAERRRQKLLKRGER